MTLSEALSAWTSKTIKKYVALLGGASTITRKDDRIAFVCRHLLEEKKLRDIWQQLDPVARRAVSNAYHNDGLFDARAFLARYGELPPRPKKEGGYSYYHSEPILFDLFVIDGRIPGDLMPLLSDLVLPVERFQLEGVDAIPETIHHWRRDLAVRQAETELVGRTDLLTYLQLVDQGALNWTAKKNELTAASVRKVVANLMDGDFHPEPDTVTGRYVIRPFGLDVFTREARLVTGAGKLTAAGRTFLQTQEAEVFLEAFEKWVENGKFDELSRIQELNGQNSRSTRLTPPASRRTKVIEALSWCPTHTWISIFDFYRAVQIWQFDFEVETTNWSNLYAGSHQEYGYMDSHDYWLIVKGLYIKAVIMEYLGTIGAVDLAYVSENVSFVDSDVHYVDEAYSLHDSLLYFRINNWGAFLLGQADSYTPTAPRKKDLFVIDGDLRVQLLGELRPNEQLQLEAVAERVKGKGYRLDQEKLLTTVESGLPFTQLAEFLQTNHRGPLPQPVADWLSRLDSNSEAFKVDEEAVVVKLCRQNLQQVIAQDAALAKLCRPLDETAVLVLAKHLNRFRKRLKESGYLLQ